MVLWTLFYSKGALQYIGTGLEVFKCKIRIVIACTVLGSTKANRREAENLKIVWGQVFNFKLGSFI
jgi:hypothetical protein